MAVVDAAYRAAITAGATHKQMLALFEAGIVESGFRNLSYGDRDSVGFLQQRAGWGSVSERMNVSHATRSFIKRAKEVDSRTISPSQLAQKVQVSAFPLRYQLVAAQALVLLEKAENRNKDLKVSPGQAFDPKGERVEDFNELIQLGKLLGNPQTWMRVLYCVTGGLLLLLFLFKATGDNKLSNTTKGIIKTGIKLAVAKKV